VSPPERARIDVKGSASAWFDALADEEHAMLGERDGGGDLSAFPLRAATTGTTDRLARLTRNRCVLSIGTPSLTAVAALALALVGCGEADGGMDGKAPSADTERTSTLFLAGDGEMWVVDAEAAGAQHLRIPELAAGDPPHRIIAIDDRLALWGYDVLSVPIADPSGPPTTLANDGWVMIPRPIATGSGSASSTPRARDRTRAW
jgi:hypothetical protein